MKKFIILLIALLLPMVASADAVEIDGIYYNLVAKIKQAEVTSNSNKYSGEVVIPESVIYDGVNYSVTSIGDYAFRDCSGLTSITIPNYVTSIGYAAFYGCSSLTSITIPNSVTSIGDYAFGTCHGLTSVYISDLEAWCKIFFGNGISNPLFYAHHLYMNGNEITNLVIPNSVTSIGNYAFYGCISLTSVTIPNSVTSIGDYAFSGCSDLTSVHISDLEAWCKIVFGKSLSNPLYYAHHLYMNGSEITNLVIPNSVKSIGVSAFNGCSGLTSITIPDGVTSIGSEAFYGCSGLTSITIGSGIKNIYNSAFAQCPELTDVTCLAENVPNTYSDAFDGSLIEYATLHVPGTAIDAYKTKDPWSGFKSVEKIVMSAHRLTYIVDGEEYKSYEIEEGATITPESEPTKEGYTFSGWSEIPETMPAHDVTVTGTFEKNNPSGSCGANLTWTYEEATKTLTISGEGAMTNYERNNFSPWYEYRDEIASAILESGVTTIGNYAFYGCSGLTSITIPNSVTSTGFQAFAGCSGLTSITIPNSVTSIGNAVFYGCSGLTSITIPNSVTSIGNAAFEDCTVLTSVTIPNSVKSIGSSAFNGCSALTSITIPDGVMSIGSEAFYGCSGLTSITIPNSVTSISDGTFYGCSGLTSISLPDGVTSIGNYAFWNCSSLTSITIPNRVTNIGKNAFRGSSGLNTVKVLAEIPPSLYDNSFSNYDITLKVPETALEMYASTSPWSNFTTIKPLRGEDNEKKIEKPEINVVDGKLVFSCATEEVEYNWSITTSNGNSGKGNNVPFTQSFTVSVYATKTGWENSDVTTKVFSGSGLAGDANGDGVVDIVDAVKIVDMIMNQE